MTAHAPQPTTRSGRVARQMTALVVALVLVWAPPARADRTPLKPGWNLFSPAQDVEIGQKVSQDAERQLPMLNDRRVDAYVDALGKRLAAKAPGAKYPYQFKVVNDRSINAFALPGGFIYVHRGIIEAADNEGHLAGVMAHEIGHVALRHGTNQASKSYAAQVPLAILGGALGSGSIGAVLAQIGAGFAVNSVLLKYSRDAERQADILGTQILYDSNYDPRAMAQFFEKIQAESKGGRMPEFFSSHPNPENRMELVNTEIQKLGGPPRGYRTDSAEFREIKRYVTSLPAPAKGGPAPGSGDGAGGGAAGRPAPPADRYQAFQNDTLRLLHPENWRAYGQGSAATFAPEGGIVDDGRGNAALAYGVILNVFEPHNDRYGQITLEAATDQLIDELRHSNPRMRIVRRHERVRVGGVTALSTLLATDSPLGGREYDWLITAVRPEGLVYLVCVAPQNDFDAYDRTFQTIVDSIRFRR
jgi:Zn-dependent protease with chaperone function